MKGECVAIYALPTLFPDICVTGANYIRFTHSSNVLDELETDSLPTILADQKEVNANQVNQEMNIA